MRCIVVEATWLHLECGGWRSSVTPHRAMCTCISWIARGVPPVMVGDPKRAGRFVSRMLYIAAQHRWQEARALVQRHAETAGWAEMSNAAVQQVLNEGA